MTPEQVESVVRAGEDAEIEFKRTLSDSRKIVETIAAMATVGGGIIVIGVADSGRVVGVDIGADSRERFAQRVLAATDPKVYVDLETVEVLGARLLVISVPPGDGPHLAFGRAFYRVGPATVAMGRAEYERRLLDRLRESGGFERRAYAETTTAPIARASLTWFLERARARGQLEAASSGELLRRLHLMAGDEVTVGGILLFGEDPQGPFPQATVRARANRAASQDQAAVEGTLFAQIDETVRFVSRNLRVRTDRSEIERKEIPELPLAAVREVVANAVAHRDYSSTAAIQLRLDDQALVVWNPGHFPPPITPAILREEHPSVPPNPYLARALYLAGYIEEWGTGTLRVIDAMREHGSPPPTFEELPAGAGIRVTLPLPGTIPPSLLARQVSFLEDTPPGTRFRAADYASSSHIARRTALGDLRALESMGLVRREGKGKATLWVRLG